jgi:hypothetical protein
VPVTIDGHPYVLVLDAAEAAAAQRAQTTQDPSLHNNYLTDAGRRIDIQWDRAAVVDVGPITPAGDVAAP